MTQPNESRPRAHSSWLGKAALPVVFCLLTNLCVQPAVIAQESETRTFEDLTSRVYQQTYMAQKKDGFRPFKADVRVVDNVAYFNVEFQNSKPLAGFVAKHNIDDAKFGAISKDLLRQGYTLSCHEVYLVEGRNLHLAYWRQEADDELGTIWKPNDKVPANGRTSRHFRALDKTFEDYLKKHQLPGATVAVSYRGKVIYERGFGYSDLDTKEEMKRNSLMRIASVSKPITGAAVMKLVDKGKLKLDAPVFDLLDITPMDPKTVDARLKDITVRHLLHHTGGFDRDQSYDPMFKPYEMSEALKKDLPIDTNDVIRYMMSQPLDFDPGERKSYSNFGYCVLGRVIEKVSEQTYVDYVQAEILNPAKARGMQIGTSLEQDRVKREVKYFLRKQIYRPSVVAPDVGKLVKRQYGGTNVPLMDAHGAWISSAADLTRFAMAFDNPKRCPLMRDAAVNEMFAVPDYLNIRPDKRGRLRYYASGWNIVRWDKGFNAYHGGALAGTSTLLVRRSDGFNWAVLFNCRKTSEGQEAKGKIDALMHGAVDAAAKSLRLK